ncbi:MAG: valine--tRNA ligase, partial [Sphingomonadales bacterium]
GARVARHEAVLKWLARLSEISVVPEADTKAALQVIVDETVFVLPLAGAIDLDAERARLNKAIEKLQKEAGSLEGRLSNEAFVAKAPEHVVAENKAKLESARSEIVKLEGALERLA